MMRARIQFLLLGIVLLASVSVSFGVLPRKSEAKKNPFYFSSDRSFLTLFKNKNGEIRVLKRFDQSSEQVQNLENYRLVEFRSKPNTLYLPHHADADFLLVVLSGRVLLTLVNPDGKDSYNLESGEAQRIPAGTIFYLVNPDPNENLRLIKLAIPVNNPHKYQDLFLSSTEVQQSYLQGFSKDILEASFDSEFKEINKVLFEEEGEQSQQEGVIVELSKEHIRQLSRHAKSSSRKTISSENEPFNLKSHKPIYSNKFGKLYEITPEKNSQLRELNIFLSYVDINEGGLLLPHFNSKSIVVLFINEGEAKVELVGPIEQQQKQQKQQKQQEEQEEQEEQEDQEDQEDQEESLEVQSYRAELSEDDVLVIPAAYPFAINATSNLNFFAFGINAENNQRNFLAGEKDNVISEIPRQVLELSFPGSGEEIDKLVKNQEESHFADAQPQQKEGGSKKKRGSLSSILGTLY